MNKCLNTGNLCREYIDLTNSSYFVDKSDMIRILNKRINTSSKYICITKPRRFGKTSILRMLGAYYGKENNTEALFDKLKIGNTTTEKDKANYKANLNKYNIIHLTLCDMPDKCETYDDYVGSIIRRLSSDIKEAYPQLRNYQYEGIYELLEATQDRFVFLIDEWDYIFSHELFTEHQNDFLEFLKGLLKDRSYIALAYMTGVLPIKRYSMGSAINMFKEYTMLNDSVYGKYFGFTEDEVKQLCAEQEELSFEEISEWYNGYITNKGQRIYNPRSVVYALEDGKCSSYWTSTGKMDEVLFFLKYNIAAVREDVIKMVNDIPVRIDIKKEYTAGQAKPYTKKEIYAAMIIYGMLSYHNRQLRIPNKEIMLEFQSALEDDNFGYVAELVKSSLDILDATLNKEADRLANYLHDIHNSEIPILQYNDENSLSCVITLAYLAARDTYRIEREEKAGKGYADFILHSLIKGEPGIIIELKNDVSAEVALKQISEKEYISKLRKEGTEDILLVGINYNSKMKEHECVIKHVSEVEKKNND